MATETGHYKNIASGNSLIEMIETFKGDYKPSKESITLLKLREYYTKGKDHITAVQQAKNNWSTIVDDRQNGFKDVKKFATRIIGILSGTNMDKKAIETAKSINTKIQGVRLVTPREKDLEKQESEPEAKTHSVSRQSYDSLYENFSDLVQLLEISEGYDPIVAEFKITNLKDYAKRLLEHTNNMDKAEAGISDVREKRNKFMYTPETGYVDIMLDTKDFIKGLFGARSEKFKNINKIKFKNFR
ncbi:MAG: hypothetical protein EOO46_06695 [Flavobacterium sp.]|nr:MAG: hypothetical protein EOO46_06695 [Flavobacterium sp.]